MRLRLLLVLLVCLSPVFLVAQNSSPDTDIVLSTLKQEMTRSLNVLKKQPVPPYFLSYELTDNHALNVSASFGAVTSRSDSKTRLLDVELRVGDDNLDNTHALHSDFPMTNFGQLNAAMPLDDDANALSVALWLETDRHYKTAVQRYQAIKADEQIKTDKEDPSPDFSAATLVNYFEPIAPFSFDRDAWEARVRRYSAAFREVPQMQSASVYASGEIETRRYVNSDGTTIRMSMPFYRLQLDASIKAQDDEVLPLHREFLSFEPEGMPDDATVMNMVAEMKQLLVALQKAPVAEPYTGPAILSGRASAVFFHEIFGHRIEGDRLKNDNDAQTFKKKIGQAVLPAFLSVYSDPTMRHLGNTDLVGYYPVDDQGVKTRRVTVVEKGILRNFLLSRSPVAGFPESNGHGRRQQGYQVEARQANLLVQSERSVSREQLKKVLIDRVKSAKKPYGLLFDDITGGFTFTSRSLPNSFAVLPTVVYRIYPDGREELVRGLDLIGTPLIAFSKISETDDETGIFNGMCGADSGWVPVSAVAPGMLIDQIEVQRKERAKANEPILPDPKAALSTGGRQ